VRSETGFERRVSQNFETYEAVMTF
jgi:hypothetical protein